MSLLLTSGFEAASSGQGSFRVDAFQVPVARGPFPHAEILYVPPNGMDAEEFFCGIRQTPDLAIRTDLALFPHAARMAQLFQGGCSLNVQAETLFDERFHRILENLAADGGFNASKVWIEKTEQGQIPEDADLGCLARIKAMGFRLAIDDLDTTDATNMARLTLIGEDADMFKFSYKTMKAIREDADGKALQRIVDIAKVYPDKIIVMEGVRHSDYALYGDLIRAGVHMFQIYDPQPKTPCSSQDQQLALRA
ncbi:MAG: EAL domain-containing protein [Pseudobdellovibrionaceae bacterium]